MKKILLFSVLAFLSFSIISQNLIEVKEVGFQQQLSSLNLSSSKAPTDTICLDDFFMVGQPTIYGYNPYGYIFGTAWDSTGTPKAPEVAQGFLMTYSGYNIEEVLIWTAYKELSSSSSGSSLDVKLAKVDGTVSYGPGGSGQYSIDCPNTILGSATIPWANIDTSGSFYDGLSIAKFNPSVYVNSDYAAIVNFENFFANNDTIGIVCSADGGGSAINGIEYTWWKYPAASPFWAQLSHIFTVGGNDIDVAIAIFPVVDATSAIVGDPQGFINGIQLGQNSPNPVSTQTLIPYAIQETSNVKLEIYNINGKLVKTIEEGTKTPGAYSIELNNEFASGTYYYSLTAGKNRLTKKMILNK